LVKAAADLLVAWVTPLEGSNPFPLRNISTAGEEKSELEKVQITNNFVIAGAAVRGEN